LERAKAYAAAGASGFFIPGLQDGALVEKICKGVSLPVNVMVMDDVPSNDPIGQARCRPDQLRSNPLHSSHGLAQGRSPESSVMACPVRGLKIH
jgi:hypothetical protein